MPDELKDQQLFKKQKISEKFQQVQARQISHFLSNLQKKSFDLQKHERLQYMKTFDSYLKKNLDFFLRIRDFWKITVFFFKLVTFLRENIKKTRRKRFLNAYMRQLRNATILTGLKTIRKKGENPMMRALFESKLFIIYKMGFKRKEIKRKSMKICSEVLYQAGI